MITDDLNLTTSLESIIESFVDNVVYSKVIKFVRKCGMGYKDLLIPLSECFKEYLCRMYKKCSVINTLVYGSVGLKDVYVTQTLINESDKEEIAIDKIPIDIIKQNKKILICDTAGRGKSTIMKRMFIDLIDKCIVDLGIPIFLELRKLTKDRSILTEIQNELNCLSKGIDEDLLMNFIQKGDFVFFLDGYDEISLTDKTVVTIDLQRFISNADVDNYFILTSRPEQDLFRFGDFQSFSIQPLTNEEAKQLLVNYDTSSYKKSSYELAELLKSGEYNEFLSNPLFMTLLPVAYDHKEVIPLKRALLYKQVFEAFFDRHDLSKGGHAHEKLSKLGVDDFGRMLECIGYICMKRTGSKFDRETILEVISVAKAYCADLDFKESDFLHDLLISVPLFCKDGNEYKWVLKSLMMYFAALFIAEEKEEIKDTILNEIYKSEELDRYFHLLDLYYEIDYWGFAKNFILPLCESYLNFYNNNDFNSITTNHNYIKERIGLLFYLNDMCYIIVRPPLRGRTTRVEIEDAKRILQEQFGESMPYRSIYHPDRSNVIYCMLDFPLNYDHIRNLLLLVWNIVKVKGNTAPFVNYQTKDSFNTYIENNKAIRIDVHTEVDNEKLYGAINDILYSFASIPILDYEACNKEVERIKAKLSRKDLFIDFFSEL